MTIDEKIKTMLAMKNLSPSRFAEEIGVQRSSISHILSGRNKPSFDIIEKILRRFPDLGMEWVLDENPLSPNDNVIEPPLANPKVEVTTVDATKPVAKEKKAAVIATAENIPAKEIEKILIFYKDKTFSEYTPSE